MAVSTRFVPQIRDAEMNNRSLSGRLVSGHGSGHACQASTTQGIRRQLVSPSGRERAGVARASSQACCGEYGGGGSVGLTAPMASADL